MTTIIKPGSLPESFDAHVGRSLQPGHLTNVDSADQHTVKAWVRCKVDLFFPYSIFTNDGFSL